MLRSIVVAAVFLAFTPSAWAAGTGFAGTTCDAPAFQTWMLSRLGHGKSFTTDKPMPGTIDYGPISQADTVSNTGNDISCEITVVFNNRAGGRPIKGRFTATSSSHGNSWKWQPGY